MAILVFYLICISTNVLPFFSCEFASVTAFLLGFSLLISLDLYITLFQQILDARHGDTCHGTPV